MISSLLHPYTLSVTIVTQGGPDEDGVPMETETTAQWGPCNVQQASSSEMRDGREVVTTTMRASGPLAQWITEGDRITYGGKHFRVDGEPAHLVGGALDHTEVNLIKWTGE